MCGVCMCSVCVVYVCVVSMVCVVCVWCGVFVVHVCGVCVVCVVWCVWCVWCGVCGVCVVCVCVWCVCLCVISENEEVSVQEVKQWTADAVAELCGCVDCHEVNGRDVFFSPVDNVDQTGTVISNYIAFCEDMIIPKKPMKSFPNSTPWN